MKLLTTFFGQILRKGDVDFIGKGARDAIVQTNIDLTAKQGGIIDGLNVFKSIDNLSVLITPGTFYSSGEFSDTNNIGGGERAKVYTTQSFTGLPQTAPIANQPSYLLVYVKVIGVNNNPDPTKLQTTVTSKNIQTGENVATRQFPVGSIVISNPILRTELNKFNGVPLALLQVDFNGTVQVSSNGTIQSIDTSVKRDYIIGGAIDIATQKLVPESIPDGFITDRMIGDGQVSGDKFLTGSIHSDAIAPYDGSANIATSGDGIATDHLKTGAVTSAKLNYSGSMDGFNSRNYLLNSSFENDSTNITNWSFTGDTGTTASVETNQASTLFGLRSAKLVGASSVGVPKSLKISQKIDFGGPINGQPITAYFYARPLSDFNLTEAGTTGITGQLEFFASPGDTTPFSGTTFAAYSGTTVSENGGFIKLQTSAPIVIPTTDTKISAINFSISGIFSNTVNVDGAFLGLTAQSPKFNVALGEQVALGLNASNITVGELDGARLADGAVVTSKIRGTGGAVIIDGGFGIRGDQIRSQTITGDNLANGTITNQQLAAGVSAVPKNAILMFMVKDGTTLSDPIAKGCPTGFAYVSELEGRFPIGANPNSSFSDYSNPGRVKGTSITGRAGAATDAYVGNTPAAGDHGHGSAGASSQSGGGASDSSQVSHQHPNAGSHVHEEQLPFVTMLFCRQL